jgi:hypothetical protein
VVENPYIELELGLFFLVLHKYSAVESVKKKDSRVTVEGVYEARALLPHRKCAMSDHSNMIEMKSAATMPTNSTSAIFKVRLKRNGNIVLMDIRPAELHVVVEEMLLVQGSDT